MEKATDLQALEYERRLTELNHARQHSIENQATFLRREVYDNYVTATLAWREEVREALAERRGGILSMREIAFRVIPLLVSTGTLVFLILKGVL